MRVVLPVALHVADLLVQFEIVGLEAPDLGAQLRDHLGLFAEFLQTRCTERAGQPKINQYPLTSSSSAFRFRKRSRWLVTMGRIDVSADGVKGIGLVWADGSFYGKRISLDLELLEPTHIRGSFGRQAKFEPQSG